MLKPGVDMRSASRAAESSAVRRLMPDAGGAECAMAVTVVRPLLLETRGLCQRRCCWGRHTVSST